MQLTRFANERAGITSEWRTFYSPNRLLAVSAHHVPGFDIRELDCNCSIAAWLHSWHCKADMGLLLTLHHASILTFSKQFSSDFKSKIYIVLYV
jgi:hypothetical protein